MKILQLIQKPQLRGAEIFACQLSNNLQHNNEIKLVSLFPGNGKLPFSGKKYELNRPISKRMWDFEGWRKLAEIIREEKPDIVQANAGDTLKFSVMSKLLYQWKSPIVFRNANKMGDFIDTKFKHLLNRFFVNKVDYVVSVSELCEQDFVKTFDYDSSKITTVPIGIDELSIPDAPPSDLKHIFAKHKVLVNVGSLVPEKNHKGLLRIFSQVASSDEDLFLIIIGDGAERQKLEEEAEGYGCKNRILFAGYRSDVLQVVKHAHAFLMPSFIEGLPGVILEAMYCHTPVVANDVGGISEVINSKTGWLIAKGDEKGFVKAVQEVMQGNGSVKEKTEQAYELVTNTYNNPKIAKRFLEVYTKVLAST